MHASKFSEIDQSLQMTERKEMIIKYRVVQWVSLLPQRNPSCWVYSFSVSSVHGVGSRSTTSLTRTNEDKLKKLINDIQV